MVTSQRDSIVVSEPGDGRKAYETLSQTACVKDPTPFDKLPKVQRDWWDRWAGNYSLDPVTKNPELAGRWIEYAAAVR